MSEADKNKIRELERELADLRRVESEKETAKKPIAKEKPIKPVKKKVEKVNDLPDWDYILGLKGIGAETLNDLKGIYDTVEALINDLKVKEVVYVRNDIVNILERELKEWL